jgi:hypothetical protein
MAERKEISNEIPVTRIEQDTNIVDVQKRAEKHEIPREVETWLQKLEVDPTQQKIVNDDNGQPLLQIPASQDPRIKLPTTRASFAAGFKKSLSEAGRWLSTFVFRLIKIKSGKVKFEEE